MEQNLCADAVFCAHTGLERANKAHDLLDGSLVGATVHVHCWRVAFDAIPTRRDDRVEWLYDHWKRVDDWVESQRENR